MSDSRMFPLAPSSIYLIVQQAASAAGLPHVRPHDLRRTYARLCRSGGAPIEQIQQTLGHASVQTTELYLGGGLETRPGLAACDYIQFGTIETAETIEQKGGESMRGPDVTTFE